MINKTHQKIGEYYYFTYNTMIFRYTKIINNHYRDQQQYHIYTNKWIDGASWTRRNDTDIPVNSQIDLFQLITN